MNSFIVQFALNCCWGFWLKNTRHTSVLIFSPKSRFFFNFFFYKKCFFNIFPVYYFEHFGPRFRIFSFSTFLIRNFFKISNFFVENFFVEILLLQDLVNHLLTIPHVQNLNAHVTPVKKLKRKKIKLKILEY